MFGVRSYSERFRCFESEGSDCVGCGTVWRFIRGTWSIGIGGGFFFIFSVDFLVLDVWYIRDSVCFGNVFFRM